MTFNHENAQSLLAQEKDNEALNMFLRHKKDEIQKKIDVIGNNIALFNDFITSLGVQCTHYTEIQAIGVLEILCVLPQQVGEPFYNVDYIFSKAYTSMCKAAVCNNKYSLKKYMDKIYNQPVLMNHTKAKEFCETKIYIEEGAKEGLIDMITNKILQAPGKYTLKDLMEDLGVTFAHSDPKEAIGVLEAINDVLNLDTIENFIQEKKLLDNDATRDNLFYEAFDNMYETAIRYRNEGLLEYLRTYLEPENPQEQHEVVALGGMEGMGNIGEY